LVLAYYPQQESVDVLLEGLFDYDGLLRYRTIRSLVKLRMLDPDLQFDRGKISLRLREESENTIWHRQVLGALYPKGNSNDLLEKLLKDKISRGEDRVLRLLALLLSSEDGHFGASGDGGRRPCETRSRGRVSG